MLPELLKRSKYYNSKAITELVIKYKSNPFEDLLTEIILAYKPILLNQLKVNNLSYDKDFDDAFSYGIEGLLDGIRDFDASKGFQFSTFVHFKIQHHLNLYKQSRTTITLPRDLFNDKANATLILKAKAKNKEKVKHNLEQIKEMVNCLDLYHERHNKSKGDSNNLQFHERLIDDKALNALNELERESSIKYIKEIANQVLTEKELKVFNLYFCGEEVISLNEISKKVGIPHTTTQTIIERCINKIKKRLKYEK